MSTRKCVIYDNDVTYRNHFLSLTCFCRGIVDILNAHVGETVEEIGNKGHTNFY